MPVHRLRDDIEWREIDADIVVLDVQAGKYFVGNRSATVLWPLLVEGATDADLAAALASRFGLTDDRAQEDVAGFLTWLEERELLRAQPS